MTGYTSGSKSSPPKKRREMRRTMVDFSKKPPGCCKMTPYVWNIFKICFKWRVLKKSNHIVASYFWGKNYDFGCAKEHSPKKLFWKKKDVKLEQLCVYSSGWYSCKSTEAQTRPKPMRLSAWGYVHSWKGRVSKPQKFHPRRPPAENCCAQKLFQDLPKSPTADPVKVLFQILDDAWRRE